MQLEDFGYPVFYNSFRDDKCPVVIGKASLHAIGQAMKVVAETPKIALIVDSSVANLYGNLVVDALKKSGFEVKFYYLAIENKAKTMKTVEKYYQFFKSIRADWGTTVLLMGGQVLIDAAAYAAITYCRGLRYVLIPTTLLSQVDGAVGGATGVHFDHLTNYIGARRQPMMVWNDMSLLNSLPLREFRCGMAEIIKQSVVADEKLFQTLEQLPRFDYSDAEFLECVILRTVSVKSGLVDRGEDTCLNFGHTIGHALESVLHIEGIKHGEGVAIGMAGEMRAAEQLLLSSAENRDRLEALLVKAELPIRIPEEFVERFKSKKSFAEKIWKNILYDKKMFAQTLKWVVPNQIGRYTRLPVEKPLALDILMQLM